MNLHNGHAMQMIVDTPREEYARVGYGARRPTGISPERREACLERVRIALTDGWPEEGHAAIDWAFAKDDSTVTPKSPISALGLDQRTSNGLEKCDVFTVGELQAKPFEWLATVRNFAGATQRRVWQALIDAGFTMAGLDGWMVAQAMQKGAELSTSKEAHVLTWGIQTDDEGKPVEDDDGKPVPIQYPAYVDHTDQLALDEHTRRRLWAAIHDTPAPETDHQPLSEAACDPGFRKHRERVL